jgi:hypothetical protein
VSLTLKTVRLKTRQTKKTNLKKKRVGGKADNQAPLSWFMIMIYSRGGHEIERMILTKKMK